MTSNSAPSPSASITLILIVSSAVALCSHAGAPDMIFSDGFETGDTSRWSNTPVSPLLVDVAPGPRWTCALDADGDIRCARWLGDETVPSSISGDFVDLAGTSNGICARTAAGAVQCWGEDRFTPDGAFETAIAGTSGFLPDMPTRLCAPTAAGDEIICLGGDPQSVAAITDFDSDSDVVSGIAECVSYAIGGIDCFDGTTSTMPTSAIFIDIAVSQSWVCGLLASGEGECYLRSGGAMVPPSDGERLNGLRNLYGLGSGSFAGLRSDGEMLLWDLALGQALVSSGSPEHFQTLNAGSNGTVCGVTIDGHTDCFGGSLEGGGLAPPGTGWTGVAGTGPRVGWTHTSGAPALIGAWSSGTRRLQATTPSMLGILQPSGFGACGLVDGEFICALGSDEWDIPPGPWLQVDPAHFTTGSWCGITASGELQCSSADPTSQISAVPTLPTGTFIQVEFESASWMTPAEQAWALDSLGNLHCWRSDGPCATPPGLDFVQLSGSFVGFNRDVALRANGELVTLTTGATIPAEVFDRYEGPFGFRADGTIGWWIDPSRAVPVGTFVDAVAVETVYPGPGSSGLDSAACAVRTDGGLLCWEDIIGGSVSITASVDGNYERIHNGSRLFATDSNGFTQPFGFGEYGTEMSAAAEYVASWRAQCMITPSASIGCNGDGYSYPGDPTGLPPGADTQSFAGLHFGHSYFCALADGLPVCWDPFTTGVPVFPARAGGAWLMVRGSPYQACAVQPGGQLVECVGSNPFGAASQFPFPQLLAGQIRDLATSAFTTCQIDNVGAVQCAGVFDFWIGPPEPTGPYQRIEIDAWATTMCLIADSGGLECFKPGTGGAPWTSILTPAGNFVDVTILAGSICAVRDDSSGSCWGMESDILAW